MQLVLPNIGAGDQQAARGGSRVAPGGHAPWGFVPPAWQQRSCSPSNPAGLREQSKPSAAKIKKKSRFSGMRICIVLCFFFFLFFFLWYAKKKKKKRFWLEVFLVFSRSPAPRPVSPGLSMNLLLSVAGTEGALTACALSLFVGRAAWPWPAVSQPLALYGAPHASVGSIKSSG